MKIQTNKITINGHYRYYTPDCPAGFGFCYETMENGKEVVSCGYHMDRKDEGDSDGFERCNYLVAQGEMKNVEKNEAKM